MSKELVISSNRHETRVAILEDDQVVEVYFQRENEYSLAGSIHKGRVTRVLPGMQSAFVDIGLERDAFLYVSDFFEDNEEYDKIVTSVEEKVLRLEKGAPAAAAAVAAPAVANAPVEARRQRSQAERRSAGGGEPPPAQEPRPQRDRPGRPGPARAPFAPAAAGRKGTAAALPESKFYTPRARGAACRRQRPKRAGARNPAEGDDFFVLPGESLAKYSHGERDEEAEAPSGRTEADDDPWSRMTRSRPVARWCSEPESEDASELPGAAPEHWICRGGSRGERIGRGGGRAKPCRRPRRLKRGTCERGRSRARGNGRHRAGGAGRAGGGGRGAGRGVRRPRLRRLAEAEARRSRGRRAGLGGRAGRGE